MASEPVRAVFWAGFIFVGICVVAILLTGCAGNCPRIGCNFN